MEIFISYSRADRQFTEKFVQLLESKGFTVWYDRELKLNGGVKWWDEILRNIKERDVFIFLASKKSVSSAYCRAELREAMRLKKQILPVRIGLDNVLPREINDVQYVDMAQGVEDAEAQAALTTTLENLANKIPNYPPEPAWLKQTPCPKPRSYYLIRGGALVSVFAFVLVMLFLIQPLCLGCVPTPTNTMTITPTFTPSATLMPIETAPVEIEVVNCPPEIEEQVNRARETLASDQVTLRVIDGRTVGSALRVECEADNVTIHLTNQPTGADFYTILWLSGIYSWGVVAEPNPIIVPAPDTDDLRHLLIAAGHYFNNGDLTEAHTQLNRLSADIPPSASLCLLRGNVALRNAYLIPERDSDGVVQLLNEFRITYLDEAVLAYQCGAEQPTDAANMNNWNIAAYDRFQQPFDVPGYGELQWADLPFSRSNEVTISGYNTGTNPVSKCLQVSGVLQAVCRAQAIHVGGLASNDWLNSLEQPLQDGINRRDGLLTLPESPLVSYYHLIYDLCQLQRPLTAAQTVINELQFQWIKDSYFEARLESIRQGALSVCELG